MYTNEAQPENMIALQVMPSCVSRQGKKGAN